MVLLQFLVELFMSSHSFGLERLSDAFKDGLISAFWSTDRGAHEGIMLTSIRIHSGSLNFVESQFLDVEVVALIKDGNRPSCLEVTSTW